MVCAKTDVGRKRRTNEDACSITELASGSVIDATDVDREIVVGERGVLLALSDGMGGHQAGEVASAMVLETLQEELRRDRDVPIDKHLEAAVLRANLMVHSAAEQAAHRGMGATLVAVMISGTEAYIAEVGDSRGYLLRGSRMRQMTRDQSLVQLLVDQGVMQPSEAKTAPQRNVILQAMGLEEDVRVALGRLQLRRGDRLLLCSDGITGELDDAELHQILTNSTPRMACETMVALANERGGRDNQTVIVADVLGEQLAAPVEFETVTSTYTSLQMFNADQVLPRLTEQQAGRPTPPPPPPAKPAAASAPASDADSDDEVEIEMIEDAPAAAPAARASSLQRWVRSLRSKLTPRS